MLGVVVPAHNEARLLPACLASIETAAACSAEPVCVVVVADACSDATAAIARSYGVDVVTIDAHCVGAARAAGVSRLLERGARWIASTDADSRVPADWLIAQCAPRADAFCGLVHVDVWCGLPARVVERFLRGYQRRHGHRHIHGANLGFSADAYRAAGGFDAVRCHEDVQLIRRIERNGGHVAWSAEGIVCTSARLDFRAPEGFGALLVQCLAEETEWMAIADGVR